MRLPLGLLVLVGLVLCGSCGTETSELPPEAGTDAGVLAPPGPVAEAPPALASPAPDAEPPSAIPSYAADLASDLVPNDATKEEEIGW
jgi:hypothetical protein